MASSSDSLSLGISELGGVRTDCLFNKEEGPYTIPWFILLPSYMYGTCIIEIANFAARDLKSSFIFTLLYS